jgi:hypothetical protein
MRHRISQLIFSLFILLATLSLPLFAQAGEVTASGSGTLNTTAVSSQYIPVKVAYAEATSDDSSPVYQVEIQWGSLEFNYTKITGRVWSPSALKYVGDDTSCTYEWICPTTNGKRNDQVTVTNRSNRAVTCTLTNDQADIGATITLTNSSYTLASAVGATEDSLPQGVTTVSVSGAYTKTKQADAGSLFISIVPVDSE